MQTKGRCKATPYDATRLKSMAEIVDDAALYPIWLNRCQSEHWLAGLMQPLLNAFFFFHSHAFSTTAKFSYTIMSGFFQHGEEEIPCSLDNNTSQGFEGWGKSFAQWASTRFIEQNGCQYSTHEYRLVASARFLYWQEHVYYLCMDYCTLNQIFRQPARDNLRLPGSLLSRKTSLTHKAVFLRIIGDEAW